MGQASGVFLCGALSCHCATQGFSNWGPADCSTVFSRGGFSDSLWLPSFQAPVKFISVNFVEKIISVSQHLGMRMDYVSQLSLQFKAIM